MTGSLADLREQKKILEANLSRLIEEFAREWDCEVTEIELFRGYESMSVSYELTDYRVEVTVKL